MKCVPKPGRSLSSTEESCLTNCLDRYQDAQIFMMDRIKSLAEKEMNKGGMN